MKVLGALSVKLTVITVLLGALVGVTTFTAVSVFGRVEALTASLTEDYLPDLRAGFSNSEGANAVRGGLLEMLLAENLAALESASKRTFERLDALRAGSSSSIPMSAALLDEVSARLKDLEAGQSQEFLAEARFAENLTGLNKSVRALTEDVTLLGSQTFASVNEMVTELAQTVSIDIDGLVNEKSVAMRTALQIKAEFNRAAGFASAFRNATNAGQATIFSDLAKTSLTRLERLLPRLESLENGVEADRAVRVSVEEIRSLLDRSGPSTVGSFDATDVVLANVIDDALFELAMFGEEVTARASDLLGTALLAEIALLSNLADVDRATERFLVSALQVASAPNAEAASESQIEFAEAAQELMTVVAAMPDANFTSLNRALSSADPETGLLAARLDSFAARRTAETAATATFSAVADLSGETAANSNRVLSETTAEAASLTSQITTANTIMLGLALVCAVVFILAQLAARIYIIGPIQTLTKQTERLATGDTSEIADLSAHGGEIAQLSGALKVFRDGQIEKRRMEAEAKDREARERQAEHRAEKERRQREDKERENTERMRQEQQERKAREAQEREEVRRKADAQRKALLAEQERVVKLLAGGLRTLAAGDLSKRIDAEMSEDHEALKSDYNDAVEALSEAIRSIIDLSKQVDEKGQAIAGSTEDVARRTEQSAATLEETAAALEELTSSVSLAAQNAKHADQLVAATSSRAQQSGEVVCQAVEAMGMIEESSEKISKIIHVIDDIAFQTNLLALNAGVEAARAGEAGRGFAVVASEVRALAQRAAEAASEINGLIIGSSDHVRRGVELVGEAGRSLESIVSEVQSVSKNMSQIATSASEQATGLAELNSSISDLDQATQKNAAKFHDTMEACQLLVQTAGQLSRSVSQFSLQEPGLNGTRGALDRKVGRAHDDNAKWLGKSHMAGAA